MKYAAHIPLQRPRRYSNTNLSELEKREISIRMKRWCRSNRQEVLRNARIWKHGSDISFTRHEKKILPVLESMFGVGLKKEFIGGNWMDFANPSYVIEVTRDFGKGISDAIRRLSGAHADGRKLILVCYPYGFGDVRRGRARKAGIEVIDLIRIDNDLPVLNQEPVVTSPS
jgi:hypothetical protein